MRTPRVRRSPLLLEAFLVTLVVSGAAAWHPAGVDRDRLVEGAIDVAWPARETGQTGESSPGVADDIVDRPASVAYRLALPGRSSDGPEGPALPLVVIPVPPGSFSPAVTRLATGLARLAGSTAEGVGSCYVVVLEPPSTTGGPRSRRESADLVLRAVAALVSTAGSAAGGETAGGQTTGGETAGDGREPERAPDSSTGILAAHPAVDSRRVYLVGESEGADLAWELLAATPEAFAAVISIGGDPGSVDPADVAATPIWIVHSREDARVPVEGARAVVSSLWNAGAANVRYSEVGTEDVAAAAWQETRLVPWLFAQSRD